MSILGNVLGLVKGVGENAWDGVKGTVGGATDKQMWNSAVKDAKAAANFAGTAVRNTDAAKEQLGSCIDSAEKCVENNVDKGRAWLRRNGGDAGQVASDFIGFQEGVGTSVYGAGKGLVQLADGEQSLTNPIDWAANPSANVARVKSAFNTAETLGKIASLADPASWMTDPQGNAQLAGALGHSAATNFKNDPAKFTGNVAGTIGTLLIPGADGAGAVADAGRAAAITQDAGEAATVTRDASAAADDTAKAAAPEPGGAAPPKEPPDRGTPRRTGQPERPDPKAIKPYQDNPRQLEGMTLAEVETLFDKTLVDQGHWIKSPMSDGNGVRYLDNKGGCVIINRGYPEGLTGGGGDTVHQGPYVKIQPGNERVPLAGNPALGGGTA
jgi:hypothetical protein